MSVVEPFHRRRYGGTGHHNNNTKRGKIALTRTIQLSKDPNAVSKLIQLNDDAAELDKPKLNGELKHISSSENNDDSDADFNSEADLVEELAAAEEFETGHEDVEEDLAEPDFGGDTETDGVMDECGLDDLDSANSDLSQHDLANGGGIDEEIERELKRLLMLNGGEEPFDCEMDKDQDEDDDDDDDDGYGVANMAKEKTQQSVAQNADSYQFFVVEDDDSLFEPENKQR